MDEDWDDEIDNNTAPIAVAKFQSLSIQDNGSRQSDKYFDDDNFTEVKRNGSSNSNSYQGQSRGRGRGR